MTRIHQQGSGKEWRCWLCAAISSLRARRVMCVLVVLAFLSSMAMAQSTTQLNGSVTDPSGGSVAGAKITLTDTATGLQRSATSNGAGLYQFLDMPPGEYRLEASAAGFATFAASVTLVVK